MTEYDIDTIDDAYTAGYVDAENALRPLIAAADALAEGLSKFETVLMKHPALHLLLADYQAARTPKGDPS